MTANDLEQLFNTKTLPNIFKQINIESADNLAIKIILRTIEGSYEALIKELEDDKDEFFISGKVSPETPPIINLNSSETLNH